MHVGDSVSARIHARPRWNDTGIRLVSGEEYRFTVPTDAAHLPQQWTDWTIVTTADGFSRWYLIPLEWMRRAPKDNWFALMGAFDRRRDTIFLIGTTRTLRAPRTGELTCFANDVWLAYGNNHGSVVLTVTRVV